MNEKIYTIKDASQKINYSERQVRQMCIDGKLKGAFKILKGRKWLIPESALVTLNPQSEAPPKVAIAHELYEETPHKGKMRELARQLQSEVNLPHILQCFIDLKPRRLRFDRRFLLNVDAKGAISVELSIDNGGDLEQMAFKAHLETGGFLDVLQSLNNWKQGVQNYFNKCHELIVTVISEIENKKRKIPLEDKKLKLGFIIDFPKTVCADAIETANGDTLGFKYKIEPHPMHNNFWLLRYGTYGIYLGKSAKTLEHYRRMHNKLILNHASDKVVKDIIQQRVELIRIRNDICQRLKIFREKEHLPGHCNEFCS